MTASVIIPAYQAAAQIADTVRAARFLSGVSEVIVVDDGSRDGTAEDARAAGADHVVILPGNRGKGAALRAGMAVASGETLLFLDADLGPSAAQAEPLLTPVSSSDPPIMTVAVFPRTGRGAGFGVAVRLAGAVIRLLSGLTCDAPMSGQRGIPSRLARHIGIAPRWGVEVALTVEAAHVGARIEEVELPLDHAHTGRTLRGFLHRGRQFRDILWYLLLVTYGLAWPALPTRARIVRVVTIMFGAGALIGLALVSSPPAQGAMALALGAALLLWLPTLWLTTVTLGLRKSNYLARSLPGAAGLLFPLVWLLTAPAFGLAQSTCWAAMIVVTGFGTLGLLDDRYGSRHQARGLRGHLRALLQGQLTSGAVKALGGLTAGLSAAWLIDRGRLGMIVVDGLLIALSANAVNLLDLRPGRALKGFVLLATVALIASPDVLKLLGPLLAAGLVSAAPDLAGRMMMGDVGSNTLGGAAGLALVLALPAWGRVAALALAAAFHLLCERHSLTRIIEQHGLLRFADRLGTAHLAPLPRIEEVKQ